MPDRTADFAAARATLERAKRAIDRERLSCSEEIHALVAIANGYTRLAEAQQANHRAYESRTAGWQHTEGVEP